MCGCHACVSQIYVAGIQLAIVHSIGHCTGYEQCLAGTLTVTQQIHVTLHASACTHLSARSCLTGMKAQHATHLEAPRVDMHVRGDVHGLPPGHTVQVRLGAYQ